MSYTIKSTVDSIRTADGMSDRIEGVANAFA